MLAKYWKRIGLIILIIACLFNVTSKLVNRLSFAKELKMAVIYLFEEKNDKK